MAASSISSLDCVISIRGQLNSTGQNPLMWIVYDSRKDNLSAIKHHFYGLEAGGSTPEGLCFESIQKQLLKDSQGRDMYFINISDADAHLLVIVQGERDEFDDIDRLHSTAQAVAKKYGQEMVEKMESFGWRFNLGRDSSEELHKLAKT